MSIEENHSLLDTSIRIKATKRLSTAWNFSDNFGTKDEHDFKSDNLKATSNTTKDEIDTERLLDSSIEAVSPAIADKEARYKAMIAHNPGDVDTMSRYGVYLKDVKHDIVSSEAMYRAALEVEPDHITTLCRLGVLLQGYKKDAESAEEIYKRVLVLDPTNVRILYNYGCILDDREEYDEAENLYQKALAHDPDHDQTLKVYARLLHDIRGNIAQAEKFYLRALKRSPDDATTNSRYAMLLYRGKNDLIAAEKRFKHSLAVKPNDVKSLVLYADFLVEAKKNYEEGAGLYQRALRLQPKSSSAMSSLKICLERISAKESAKAAAISQLQQKTTPPVSTKEGIPGDANAENSQKSIDSSLHVALFLEKRQDYAGAEDSYNECIRIDPNSVEALYAYGKFLCSVRQESIKAAEMFDAALRHNPTHLPSLVEAAKLHHLSIKDYSKADSLYRAAIELGSDHSDLLYYFGCFCKDVDKDLDRAQEYFDKQIALDENSVHIPCLYESSLINIIKKEFVEADRKLKLITTLEPTNLSALYNYAFLKMIGFKKYAAAEKLFVDVLNRDPNHAEALCNYACLQYKFRHDERKAEKYLQRLLDLDPNHIKGLFNYSVLLYNHVPHDLTSTLVEPPHSVVSSLVNDFIPHLKKTVKHLISLPDCPDSYKEKVESMLMGVSTFERSLISKTPVCPVEDSHEFVASVINIIIPSYGDEQSVKNERRSKRDLVFNSIQDETESVVVQENLNSSTGIDEFPTAELESATS